VQLLIALFLSVVARPVLEDERLNEKFQAARPYDLRKIVFASGTWVVGDKEIGPPGQRHTLGSMEWPWAHPGGTFGGAITQKFVWPPNVRPSNLGGVQKLSYGNNQGSVVRRKSRPAWVWPKETTLFELHRHPKGHAFELRVLEKNDDDRGFDSYDAFVFRPFNSSDDLPFHAHAVEVQSRVVRSTHPLNPFHQRGRLHYYGDQRVDWGELTSKAWRDSTGHEWHHAGIGNGWLSPKNYQGWLVGSERDACAKCHDNAGASVDKFEPVRDWYGFLPGGDGIFSFDPIDRRTVSRRGPDRRPFAWRNN